jgi:peptidoglycan/xylan/chitin deacetylase (PgdA/CDA1 family)
MSERSVTNLALRGAKHILAGVCYYGGLLSLGRKASISEKGIKIINYHRVDDDDFDPLNLNVKIEHFERQIRYLKRNYDIISLEQAVSSLTRGQAPGRAVVVTFDDGYKDNYTNAFPILEAYDAPATIFLTVGVIDSEKILWYDLIANAFKKTLKEKLDLRNYGLREYKTSTLGDRTFAAKETAIYAKNLSIETRDLFIIDLLKGLDVRYDDIKNSDLMLTWEDIAGMNNGLITFGNHGISHTIMTNLTPEEVSRELEDSKKILEQKTGLQVSFFAYPNGRRTDFNAEIKLSLKNSGYSCACTLINGFNKPGIDRFELRRTCISSGASLGLSGKFSIPIFAAEISGVFDHFKTLIGRNN